MRYLKKPITPEAMDKMRISLSVRGIKVGPEPHCDFCGHPTPVVVYASSKMSTGERKQCWRWCACERCDTFITVRNWASLVGRLVRVIETRMPGLPHLMVVDAANMALDEFFKYAIMVEDSGEMEGR